MYTPLYFCQMLDLRNLPYQNKWADTFNRALLENDDIMQFVWYDTDFMNPEYTGKYKYINDMLMQDRAYMYKAFTNDGEIPSDPDEDKALAAELFSSYLMPNEWAVNKQVYKFDAELELSLADTEEIHLPIRILDRLPYQTFYIEFAEDGIFRNHFHGAFVKIVKNGDGYLVYIERVKEDGRAMFGNLPLVPPSSEDGVFFFDKYSFPSEDFDRNKDWKEFGFFLLNALLYLCAENAEIRESQITKNTYKPRKEIKNKFSEVRQWECGYRYGAAIRKKYISKPTNADNEHDNKKGVEVKAKRSLPAHTRRAHWHHFWTGPRNGERKLILRWVAPTFVSGTECNVAVVHKCD